MSSFALKTKENLCSLNIKSLCCKKSLFFGIIFYGAKFGIDEITFFTECEELCTLCERLLLECYEADCDIEYFSSGFRVKLKDREAISAIIRDKNKMKYCTSCKLHYLRGAFLACGTLNSPDSSFRLELSAKRNLDELKSLLSELSLKYSSTVRSGENLIYIKESESICDFLNYIGARNAAFTLINEKIVREIRNKVNREKNCDTANISKATAAAKVHRDAIEKLIKENKLKLLPESLRETAKLRIEYPEATLTELSELHENKISKSGLNHRLKKIVEFANQ